MSDALRAYEPAELVHPGQTLIDWLDQAGMSQADFAKRTSLTPKHINQVAKGGAGISAEVARAFETVTGIPARYWLQLDANYQTAFQRQAEAANLAAQTDLLEQFPYKELVARGAVADVVPKVERLRQIFRFFGVADRAALLQVSLDPALYRLSKAFEPTAGALAAWVRMAELKAAEIETEPFDMARCRDALVEIRALSQLPGIEWLGPLQRKTAEVGIALVIVKELKGCRVNGVTRWLTPDKAMVALSLRYRRNDIFWFTLFHELCHVLRHSKKEVFVDGKSSGIEQDLEQEADSFASRLLIAPTDAAQLPLLTTEEQVVAFAKDIGVAPGIVVGRMRFLGLIPQNRWAHLIDHFRFADD
jgi:HTH-type transcriptional regulator/antitoxin HigA